MAMVDPYQYLADLTPPKLILLGTNDRYWPLDALKLTGTDSRNRNACSTYRTRATA